MPMVIRRLFLGFYLTWFYSRGWLEVRPLTLNCRILDSDELRAARERSGHFGAFAAFDYKDIVSSQF